MHPAKPLTLAAVLLLAGCWFVPNDATPPNLKMRNIQEADLPPAVKVASASLRADGKVSGYQVLEGSDGTAQYLFVVDTEGRRYNLRYMQDGRQLEARTELTPLPLTPLPPELTMPFTLLAAHGRLYMVLRAKPETLALVITCDLPTPLNAPIRRTVGRGLSVRLALNERAIYSITPSGAAPLPALPSEILNASAGTIDVVPTEVPKQVNVTLRDVHFAGTQLKSLGPLTVLLDQSPPP